MSNLPPDPDAPFLRACRGEATPWTPVWIMRQAGRTMNEYLELRARLSFLELCERPDLCAEMAVLACERLEADAAILFSDILLVLQPFGFTLQYVEGQGPILDPPLRAAGQVDALPEVDGGTALPHVLEAVRQTRAALRPETPLIGFSGAPFTLASYLIEGGPSRAFALTKRFMYQDPGAWHALMEKLVRTCAGYLQAQVTAGAQALQVFDSWVGCLAPPDYRELVRPHMEALFAALPAEVPHIHFATGAATLADDMLVPGVDVLGLDHRTPLAATWERTGARGVQGNLDPCALLAPPDRLAGLVDRVLADAGGRPGHIFNLGSGLLPETDFEQAIRMVAHVHERTT
jgi:uroporphyrinogen decarboxylase